MSSIESYLDQIRSNLHLDPSTESRVIGELETYFEDKVEELQSEGLTKTAAAQAAIRSFGRPSTVAKLIYEAHSRGSWLEALLAAQPHLLGAALFATHLWSEPFILFFSFSVLALITLLGWLRGRPNWLYPWVGCASAPILALVFLSRNFVYTSTLDLILGSGIAAEHVRLLLFLALYAVAFWIVLAVVPRILRRDWLLVSFMLVPLPVLGIWIAAIDHGEVVHRWDQGMVCAFLLLAAVSAVFIRLRQRVYKIGLLLIIGVGSTIVAGWGMLEAHSFLSLLLLSGISLSTMLVPAVIEAFLGHGERLR